MSKPTYTCCHCGAPKAITKSGVRLKRCRDCHNRICAEWAAKNLERRREISKAGASKWRARNPEKALSYKQTEGAKEKASLYFRQWSRRPDVAFRLSVKVRNRNAKLQAAGHVTAGEWRLRLKEFANRCGYCLKPSSRLDMDHMIPISKGGSHHIDNIIPACRPCNAAKKDKPMFAMLNRRVG